jgi:hypothetical protein
MNGKMFVFSAILASAMFSGTGADVGAQETQFREAITVHAPAPGATKAGAADHYLTFSGPVAIPGVSLGAGTYLFRRPSTNVLQILSAKRQPYAMVQTIATTRMKTDNRYEFVLGAPLAPGAPRRLEAWFLPGESTGQQLIYPKR